MVPSFPAQMTSCGSCLHFTRTYLQQKTPTQMLGPPCSQTSIESRVSPAQAGLCEGPLTLEECHRVLGGMARCKTPCLDDLPMEFYLSFWDLLGADLVEVLNSCYRSGRLSPSQRSGVISLSFKKGDRLDPKNWRPISLLGIDYKIASPAIAGRLLKVIEHVVAPEQTCGVPGRYIGENVAFLRDVVSFATSSGTPVAILSTRKRLSIGWTGPFFTALCNTWALGHPSPAGSIYFTRTSAAR